MAKRSFKSFVERELGKFPLFVIYAILEWILIIILFIDGFLAFAANEFAKFFEMRIPCLLCTRIDHVLVRKNPDCYYNESVCESHKKEVSSLAYCHVHKKLSDIRKMCEGCLLSFATEKESDCDTYKSLVGILHKDLDCFVQDDSHIQLSLPTLKRSEDSSSMHLEKDLVTDQGCSCCGEPLKMKFSSSNLKGGSLGKPRKSPSPISQAPAPSPRGPLATLRNGEGPNLMLPHIRYAELNKLMSDAADPETQDDDIAFNGIIPENRGKEDNKAASVPLLTDADVINEASRTPTFYRGNKFFGIPLGDSANASPKWSSRPLRRSPLEKMEFASQESIETNASSNEPENYSIVNHLKRQVKLDRKSLMALYMELDEERSASAVAANNAMAMITRLQAEKAAVQMEALQYQRMMEEQAEYDQEALQETNNLLGKREEEMKVLEAELEAYRKKFGCLKEDDYELCKVYMNEEYEDLEPPSYSFSNGGSECDSPPSSAHTDHSKNHDQYEMDNGFEDGLATTTEREMK